MNALHRTAAYGGNDTSWAWLGARLEGDRRLIRSLVQGLVEELMAVEVDARCWSPTGERVNRRNGYRHALYVLSFGSVPVRVPKLRQGGYAPAWLSEQPGGTESTVIETLCHAYVDGMSGDHVERLVVALGVVGLTPPQQTTVASAMNTRIDAQHARLLLDVHGDDVVVETRPAAGHRNAAMSVATTSVTGEHEVLGVVVGAADAETAEEELRDDLLARGLRGDVPASAPAPRARLPRSISIVVRRHGRGYEPDDDEGHDDARRRRIPLVIAAIAAVVLVALVIVGASAARRLGSDPAPKPPSTRPPAAVTTTDASGLVPSAPSPTTPSAATIAPATSPTAPCTGNAPGQRVPLMNEVLCEASAS